MTGFVIGAWLAIPLRVLVGGRQEMSPAVNFALGATTLWAYADYLL